MNTSCLFLSASLLTGRVLNQRAAGFSAKFFGLYCLYLAVLSVIAFFLYFADKTRAKRGRWRIRESTLLAAGFFGGAAGALLGMCLCRHKTRHWYFWAVNVLGLALQTALLLYLLR